MNPGQQETLVWALRRLVAYHEWSEPPSVTVADALQSAADALQEGALSIAAAEILIAVWQPFVGLEAHAGNRPTAYVIAETDAELQRHIIAEMRTFIVRETSPAKRVHLTRLMEQQIEIFAERGSCDRDQPSLRAS